MPLQQKFVALIGETAQLFSQQETRPDQDRARIDKLRSYALELVSEAGSPTFDRFLTYILGTNSISQHYPLQTVRLTSLVATMMASTTELPPNIKEEAITAAFFSDIGFRAAWLGQKGSHAELTANALREFDFPWFTPVVERSILNHHQPEKDPTPFKALGLAARYLGLVYGMGVDQAPRMMLTPAKALETLVRDLPAEKDSIQRLIAILSAFPLGSFVELNTGQTVLVIGSNPDNPSRPRIGYIASAGVGAATWVERSLQEEGTFQITKELEPNPLQAKFLAMPQAWLPGWVGETPLSDAEQARAFPVNPTPSLHLPAREPAPMAPPTAATSPVVPSINPTLTSQGAEAELEKLRTDWEQNVRQIEESVNKLRDGLLESYRRENEHFREVLTRFGAKLPPPPTAVVPPAAAPVLPISPMPAQSTAPVAPKPASIPVQSPAAPAPAAAPANPLEPLLREIDRTLEEINARISERTSVYQAADATCGRILMDLGNLLTDTRNKIPPTAPQMHQWLEQLEKEIRAFEHDVVRSLATSRSAYFDMQATVATARAFGDSVRRATGTKEPAAAWDARWQEHLKVLMDRRTRMLAEGTSQQSRLTRIEQLAKEYRAMLEGLRKKI